MGSVSAAVRQATDNARPFRRSLAVVIGINAYRGSIPALRTAVPDAARVAEILATQHGYDTVTILDERATHARLLTLLKEELPAQVMADDRVCFYFAGHGVAIDGTEGGQGPNGYLLPHDAALGDESTYLSMPLVHDALLALPCRHMLIILDSCFSGAFRWSGTRAVPDLPAVIHQERYDRFLRDPAWQVITSAAQDQTALDGLISGSLGNRDRDGESHSPFAVALFRALEGAGDLVPKAGGDGVITATELYMCLEDQLQTATIEAGKRQTPRFWPLSKHGKGEFIFLTPGRPLTLTPAPELTFDMNPWRGLDAYEQADKEIFFGRDEAIATLQHTLEAQAFVAVLGASGTGKSSLVRAGLLPRLDADVWSIMPVMRPGRAPLDALAQSVAALNPAAAPPAGADGVTTAVSAWCAANPGRRLLLVIDQGEELVTMTAADDRDAVLQLLARQLDTHGDQVRVMLTLRTDFEPQFDRSALAARWKGARFLVPPMSRTDLENVIERPASQRVLYFDSPGLVETLLNDVVNAPGALPLLSFTLSEMYVRYVKRQGTDRALTRADYDAVGGVEGALVCCADAEYTRLDAAHQDTMRKIMLRMVSVEGEAELASRRVPMEDLVYSEAETPLVAAVVENLVRARLMVKDVGGRNCLAPAHDALIRAWKPLHEWIYDVGREQLVLGTKLGGVANEFAQSRNEGLLWDDSPHLPVLEEELAKPRRWFNATEIAFIKQSAVRRQALLQERENRLQEIAKQQKEIETQQAARATLQRRAAWALCVAAVWLLGLLAWVVVQTQEVSRGNSSVLTAAAEVASDAKLFDRSLRLGILASRSSWLHPAHATAAPALARAAHSSQLLALFTDGAAFPESTSFNPDGTRLITAGGSAARIWEADTGKLLGELAHEDIASASFSPDGTRVITTAGNTARIWDAVTRKLLREIMQADEITSASISPDGRRALTAGGHAARIWDAETGTLVRELTHDAVVMSASFSSDGTRVITAAGKMARLWDAETGKIRRQIKQSDEIHAATFSPDGTRVVSMAGELNARGRVWDAKTGRLLGATKEDPDAAETVMSVSRDGTRVFTASFVITPSQAVVMASPDVSARLLDAETGESLGELKYGGTLRFPSGFYGFSPDGARVLTISEDKAVRVWDASANPGALLGELRLDGRELRSARFSSDGTRVVTAAEGGSIAVWNAMSATPLSEFAHDRAVISAVFNPDGTRVLTAAGKTARIWEAETGRPPIEIEQDEAISSIPSFSPDGAHVLTAGGKTARLWEAATGKPLGEMKQDDTLEFASFSGDGARVLTNAGKVARIWNAATLELMGEVTQDTKLASASFSRDGTRVLTAAGKTARIWDGMTRTLAFEMKVEMTQDDYEMAEAIFSPDGTRVLTTSDSNGNTVRLWDATTGKRLVEMTHDREGVAFVTSARFSPDGTRVVTASADTTARIWDTATGALLGELKHDGLVFNAYFSSDGRRVLTVSVGHVARIWDAATGKPLGELKHDAEIGGGNFSLDGTRVVTISDDGIARVWDASWPAVSRTGSLIRDVCQRKLRGQARRITEADVRASRILSVQRIGEDVCDGVATAGAR
jgi:WD40 repeat protein/type II secretory pathway predicted ATPase ExeA